MTQLNRELKDGDWWGYSKDTDPADAVADIAAYLEIPVTHLEHIQNEGAILVRIKPKHRNQTTINITIAPEPNAGTQLGLL